jgi:DNA-binding NarL/FixJ family response regulator
VSIFNHRTGEQFDFINDEFVKAPNLSLTDEELMILEWMIKGLSDKLICERLGDGDKPMPTTNFKRRKRILYDKLEASTSAEAIYKAKMMGVI